VTIVAGQASAIVDAPGPGADRDRPYVLRRQIGFMLRLAFQHHTAIFTARMVGGLTQPQYAALWTLRDLGLCSQNSLGRLIALDSATIKGVIARLEQRGLVRALPDPNDRRRLVLSVTEAGQALLLEAQQAAAAISDATLAELTAPERRQLLQLLEKMYAVSSIAAPSYVRRRAARRDAAGERKGDGHV
jgi:DNA-binding MarR family transcriptional regulator